MRSPRAVPIVPSRATETTAYEDTLPALPKEVWAYIFDIRAATTIQASVRGFSSDNIFDDFILDMKAALKKPCFRRRRAPRHKKITVAVRHLEDAGH